MIGANKEERHLVKSIVNAFRKEFPTAFRRNRKPTKKTRKQMQEFSDYVNYLTKKRLLKFFEGLVKND